MVYFLHVNNQSQVSTYQYTLPSENATFQEVQQQIAHQLGLPENSISFSIHENARPLPNHTMLVQSIFQDGDDIFVSISKLQKPPTQPVAIPKPIQKEEVKAEQHYFTLSKYKFYEADDWNIRVIVELDKIGKVPKDNFKSRFLERSFEIKIHNYQNKNWVFGIGKTMNKMNPDGCRFTVKDDKIMITLKKVKKEDNWFSLVPVRTIGGHDSD